MLPNPTTALVTQDKALEVVLLECCELLGRYVVPESYLPHILSRVKEEPDINPTRSRCSRLKTQPGRKFPSQRYTLRVCCFDHTRFLRVSLMFILEAVSLTFIPVRALQRAILLAILGKFVEGTLPKALLLYITEIFEAVTGERIPTSLSIRGRGKPLNKSSRCQYRYLRCLTSLL